VGHLISPLDWQAQNIDTGGVGTGQPAPGEVRGGQPAAGVVATAHPASGVVGAGQRNVSSVGQGTKPEGQTGGKVCGPGCAGPPGSPGRPRATARAAIEPPRNSA
jgi:hypothetical protein